MKKFLLPIILLIFFVFESVIMQYLPTGLFNQDRILVPHFLIVVILFLTIFGNRKRGIIYALIFGLLFDVAYTEVIGIHLFMFPLIAYIVGSIMRILQSNIIIAIFVSMLGVFLLEVGVYELNFLLNITDMNFVTFMEIRLVPTLIVNFIFVLILAYPLKKQFEKYAEELNNE